MYLLWTVWLSCCGFNEHRGYSLQFHFKTINLRFSSRLRWTRREQADFYRTVSSFGVVYDTDVKAFDWSQFRVLARLERKTDGSLERYFNSFVNMCRTACKLPPRKDEGKTFFFFFFLNDQLLAIPLIFHIRNSWQQHMLLSDIRLLNPPTVILMLFCFQTLKLGILMMEFILSHLLLCHTSCFPLLPFYQFDCSCCYSGWSCHLCRASDRRASRTDLISHWVAPQDQRAGV